MTDESPVGGGYSGEERELAGYLDELISATCAERAAPGKSIEGLAASQATPVCPQSQEPEEAITPEPTSPSEAPPRKPSTSARQARGAGRASMRDELLALFRDTDRAAPLPPSPPAPLRDPTLPTPEPSVFLRRFLQQAARSPELVPSGLTELDALLDGGFGSGLHVVQGGPGVGKTAFLESAAWEAVSSGRPVLYYALKEGSVGAWERLISTLGNILGTVIPLGTLRACTLRPDGLETLARLDRALQASVLPFLSLIETIPAHADALGALVEDLRSKVQDARERHGRIPLLLIDDLERLLLLTRTQPPMALLSRLDDALAADSIPGLLASQAPDQSLNGLQGIPAHTAMTLVPVPAPANDDYGAVNLELRTNARTGWTGTLPLLLDKRSGLFTVPATGGAQETI